MISINGISIKTKLARDNESRASGLMGVKTMGPNQGMLFLFPDSYPRSFWMKDTHIPLSIAYIDEDYKIINIEDMDPYDTSGVPSMAPAKCALEMNQGWFETNGVLLGDRVDGIAEIYAESILRKSIRALLETPSEQT